MPRHPNRRTVVRAAVWTAPVVAMATAAPALAVSAGAQLRFDTFNLFGADYNKSGDPTTLESKVQVENVFVTNGPTLKTVTLTVSYPDTRTNGGKPTQVNGAGWSFASAAHTDGTWTYTFLFVGSVPTSQSTPELDYRVPLTSTEAGTITITGSAFAVGASAVSTASWSGK
jgi:hypothetical protein